jgi:hypothetical protein
MGLRTERWLIGLLAVVQALPAFASGREGEGLVDAVKLIVYAVLIALIVTTSGGVLYGGYKAQQAGNPLLKGLAIGLWKGILAFLITVAVAMVALTVLGGLWIGWSFFAVYVLGWYK